MKFIKKHHTLLLFLFVLTLIVLISYDPLFARPGGGHSYSGGGGGGGGGDLIGLVIYLLFSLLPPYISIPLIIIIIIFYNRAKKKAEKNQKTQVVSNPSVANVAYNASITEQKITKLKTIDPNFSRVLFIDFLHLLYTKFYAFQSDKNLIATIKPFFDQSVLNSTQNNNAKISEIVVANITINDIAFLENKITINLEINANYTATQAGKSVRYIVTEKWLVERDKNVLSQNPEKMQALSCPNCGAPAKFNDAGYCEYCNTLIVPGKQQWFVKARSITYIEALKTQSLITYAAEVGTNYPTIYSPSIQQQKEMFASMHNTTWDKYWSILYHKVASPYFMEIYKHWSDLTWDKVRHLLTDRLWEAYNFWIEEYKRHGFINKLDDTQIDKMHVAKIEIDKFYEAITLRIFAHTKDYVVDKTGKVIAGNPRNARYFSEYWTFIRRTGVEKDDYDMTSCPNCGAPLDKMGQNGVCEYCGAKVTTGNFSWVLAAIIQDDEYRG